VERSEAAKTRRRGDRRSPFDRFVQTAHRGVSRTPFFVVCACIVATWLVSVPLWEDLKECRRSFTRSQVPSRCCWWRCSRTPVAAEEAAQEKLNVIAEALAELMSSGARQDPDLQEAADRLREAVGLEGRH
jgi:hypothetical protein